MFTVTWSRLLSEEAASVPGKFMSESTHSSGKRAKSQAFEIAWLGFRAWPGTCWEDLSCDPNTVAGRISMKATTVKDTISFFLVGCVVMGTWFMFGARIVVVLTEQLALDVPSLS